MSASRVEQAIASMPAIGSIVATELRAQADALRARADELDPCGESYDRQREEHARDLLRQWAVAASNAGCPPAFIDRMRTFAEMHDRHASEATA